MNPQDLPTIQVTDAPALDDVTVTFTLMPKKGVTAEQMVAVARELDEENGVDADDEPYSYAQALVVILHNAPERLHEFLDGWSVEDAWSSLGEDADDGSHEHYPRGAHS